MLSGTIGSPNTHVHIRRNRRRQIAYVRPRGLWGGPSSGWPTIRSKRWR